MIDLGALDVGGTHVSAALISPGDQALDVCTQPLDSNGSAEDIVAAIVAATRGRKASTWVVAMPGPFDYAAGVGTFDGVAKFGGLRGFPLAEALRAELPGLRDLHFLNDADAYGLGEASRGAGMSAHRLLCLTFGTGVGSAFLEAGKIVADGRVPPEGAVNNLSHRSRPLEDWMSRRALLGTWAANGGEPGCDVADIAMRALAGDRLANDVFADAYRELATALNPWLRAFDADRVVVGGSIARSWQLVTRYFVPHLDDVPVLPAALGPCAPLWGAAQHVWSLDCQSRALP